MISKPFATLNMFKSKFQEVCYQKIIKSSFEKLLEILNTDEFEEIRDIFIASYTLQDDFYIIKNNVTESDKTTLKDTVFDNLYYNWFVGYPKNSDTDIIFYIMFTNYKGRFEDEAKKSNVNLYILASEENYNEGFYIAELIQGIIIRNYEEIESKTFSGYVFESVTNNNEFTIENDQFLLEVNSRDFYLFKLGFSLVYYSV
ncbi:MAG TPA: hypothetical protein PK771_08380 [Spirochaetota bacterium]|mgnify:FL=1|nr:hypothetical protein [Spirochaetota bacterium]